jgi:hypothetical protein
MLLAIFVVLWCLLFVVCWPLAIALLLLLPIIWLLSIPFRIVGAAIDGVVHLLRSLFLLPARVLSGPATRRRTRPTA